jgi:hypothetical protein
MNLLIFYNPLTKCFDISASYEGESYHEPDASDLDAIDALFRFLHMLNNTVVEGVGEGVVGEDNSKRAVPINKFLGGKYAN